MTRVLVSSHLFIREILIEYFLRACRWGCKESRLQAVPLRRHSAQEREMERGLIAKQYD